MLGNLTTMFGSGSSPSLGGGTADATGGLTGAVSNRFGSVSTGGLGLFKIAVIGAILVGGLWVYKKM
jgi:hypothetical protein